MNRRLCNLLTVFLVSHSAMACALMASADESTSGSRIEVTDARFRVVKADGGILQGTELVGLVLHLRNSQGDPIDIRVDSVTALVDQPKAGIELYDLSRRGASGDWAPLCKPGADGRALGFPLPGATPADDESPASGGEFSITCTAGARGKCVMLGYRPWAAAESGESLHPYFAACVRMMRADYCGDGRPHTRPGVQVDMWDRAGVQTPQTGLPFEAAWGPDGAICVKRSRVAGISTLGDVQEDCPRLAAHADDCESWSQLPANGALLWNRSPAGN